LDLDKDRKKIDLYDMEKSTAAVSGSSAKNPFLPHILWGFPIAFPFTNTVYHYTLKKEVKSSGYSNSNQMLIFRLKSTTKKRPHRNVTHRLIV
jgi:hypothetical protein